MADESRQQGDSPELEKVRVEQSSVYQDLSFSEPTHRERTASHLAYAVVAIFGVCVLISLAVGACLLRRTSTMDQGAVEATLAYLKAVGGLFTPLLGFILGYYFTKQQE